MGAEALPGAPLLRQGVVSRPTYVVMETSGKGSAFLAGVFALVTSLGGIALAIGLVAR